VTDELVEAKAWLAQAEGHGDEAVRMMRSIADKEEGEAEASQGIPAHEMVGDMLLESKHPEEALVEYETTLKTNPGRFDALYGAAQAAEQAGKHDQATDYFAKLVKNCEGATSERAELKHAREVMEARAAKN
jgi:tetratricopeptide (TPR) repeat protein